MTGPQPHDPKTPPRVTPTSPLNARCSTGSTPAMNPARVRAPTGRITARTANAATARNRGIPRHGAAAVRHAWGILAGFFDANRCRISRTKKTASAGTNRTGRFPVLVAVDAAAGGGAHREATSMPSDSVTRTQQSRQQATIARPDFGSMHAPNGRAPSETVTSSSPVAAHAKLVISAGSRISRWAGSHRMKCTGRAARRRSSGAWRLSSRPASGGGRNAEMVICISKHHVVPVVAIWRLEWVTGPVTYCDNCAAWMRRVAEVMGVHVPERNIGLPTADEIHSRRLRVRDDEG